MKRHEALHTLSHDHQNALARALRLRRASELDATGRRDGARAFLAFVDERVAPHFVAEEAVLDRAVELTGSPEVADERNRLRDEHRSLRRRFDELRAGLERGDELDASLLLGIGQQLTDHIRYEERQLFELLQQELDGDALRAAVVAGHA